MKTFIAALCLFIALPAVAAPKDYIAEQVKEDGTICAKVQIVTIGNAIANRSFCLTENEWIEAGFKVSRRKIARVESKKNEQSI